MKCEVCDLTAEIQSIKKARSTVYHTSSAYTGLQKTRWMNSISSLVEYILDTFKDIDAFNLESAEISLLFWLVFLMRGLQN